MPRFKLPYLTFDGDRHGTVRLYVRVPGQPKICIRERPGSPEFMDAYHRAVAEGAAARRSSPEAAKAGSFRHLCVRYYASAAFTRFDEGTQAWRRHHLDLLARDHGDKPVAVLQPKHVRKLRDELKDSPIVANVRLKALRALFCWAVEEEEAPHDPTLGVKALRHVSKGFHSWELHEIEAYENRHPVGSKARLAMALLLYTACRREDAVRLGPQHLRGGRIRYRQAKNEHRSPVDLDIPVHPDLQQVIDAAPSGHLTFLTTAYGRLFSTAGSRAWLSAARPRTRSWRSPATGRSRRSSATRAPQGRAGWPTPR